MGNFLAMSSVGFRHVGSVLEWAEKEKAPITVDEFNATVDIGYWKGAGCDHLEISASLWARLSNKTEGEALNCIRTVEKGNGVEAWRKLHAEYRPSTATQAMGYMTHSLTQAPAKDAEHAMAASNTFEENVRCYEECGQQYHLDDVVKSAKLQQIMPIKVQEFIALKCPVEVNYPDMRRCVADYLLNFTKGAAPMLNNFEKTDRPKREATLVQRWQQGWPAVGQDIGYYGADWYWDKAGWGEEGGATHA